MVPGEASAVLWDTTAEGGDDALDRCEGIYFAEAVVAHRAAEQAY